MLGMLLGSVFSGVLGASSANKAAQAQTQAAGQANETQRYIFDKSVALTEPQRQVGNNALAALASQYGLAQAPAGFSGGPARPDATGFNPSLSDFRADPGYQFQMDQGKQAIDRTAAARGMRMGGATMKAQQQYGQGMADQSYGNWFARMQDNYFRNYGQQYGQYADAQSALSGLAGIGQQATGQQIGAGQTYGANVGNNLMTAGQARASGYAGVNDAAQGTVNNLFSIYGMKQAGYFN